MRLNSIVNTNLVNNNQYKVSFDQTNQSKDIAFEKNIKKNTFNAVVISTALVLDAVLILGACVALNAINKAFFGKSLVQEIPDNFNVLKKELPEMYNQLKEIKYRNLIK